MIVYNNIFQRLSRAGWSTYRLTKSGIMGSGTIQRINAGLSISTETIDKICALCDCQPGDILKFIPDKGEE